MKQEKSAFGHFRTPLWGAQGKDVFGEDVDLGMIAGALVNEKDIADGLFTPDIPWPSDFPQGGDLLFFKQRPMAVSTRAELNTRNGDVEPIHRIHVTGGTNGIRLDALRRYQPFTPSFIGRAEDQGYLLSVLNDKKQPASLRYIHASGLIMRHDKAAFAGDAVKAGKAGSYVGDLIRLFVFSAYARFLPGGPEQIKRLVDPFTGCFITPIPATLALLSLALHLLSAGNEDGRKEILALANKRLPDWIKNYDGKSASLKSLWFQEKRGWNAYYAALNKLEAAVKAGHDGVLQTSRQFKEIIEKLQSNRQMIHVQWFPGHMARTKRTILENLKRIDVIIEVLDARAPEASSNPLLRQITQSKPRLIVLNKDDLADSAVTALWAESFKQDGKVLPLRISGRQGKGLSSIAPACKKLCEGKSWLARRPVRALIVGIPNVGKSTIINGLAGRKKAEAGATPGLTRHLRRIPVNRQLELFDTPGLLWHKFEKPQTGIVLSALGAIKETVLPEEDVTRKVLAYLAQYYPKPLADRYKLAIIPEDSYELLDTIGRKRGCITAGQMVDLSTCLSNGSKRYSRGEIWGHQSGEAGLEEL